LLTPDDFQQNNLPKSARIQVPSSWNGQTLGAQANDRKPLPRFGYATYRKIINIPDEQIGITKALFFESIGSSYRVAVNGQWIEQIGQMATKATSETPWIRMNLVYFTPTSNQVEIVIQGDKITVKAGTLTDNVQNKNVVVEVTVTLD